MDDYLKSLLEEMVKERKKKKKDKKKIDISIEKRKTEKEIKKDFESKKNELNKKWYKITKMKIKENDLGLDQREINRIIDNLSKYRDLIGCGTDGQIAINGLSGMEYLNKISKLQKMIKKMKKGKCEGIINVGRFYSVQNIGKNYEE